MNYKYREGELIEEFKNYIDSTYQQHYVTDGKQTMDSIIANGHGTGFCLGNVDKYKDRYGKKGETPDEWRKDLIKVMHYTLFQLFIHDKEHEGAITSQPAEQPLFLTEADIFSSSQIEMNFGERNSIDDASPSEWDAVAEKMRKLSKYDYPSYPNEL